MRVTLPVPFLTGDVTTVRATDTMEAAIPTPIYPMVP